MVLLCRHALERQSSSATKAVGTWAEALLEALRERAAAEVVAAPWEEGVGGERVLYVETNRLQVDRLRRETTESKRKAAADKRKQILKSMGMAVSPPGASRSGKVTCSTPPIPSDQAMRGGVLHCR